MTDAPAPRPAPDSLLVEIAEYATHARIDDLAAHDAARACLLDALASALRALRLPECARMLGPVVRGATMVGGARVPGTSYELDPVKAAFDIGCAIRWSAADDAAPAPASAPASACAHQADTLGALLAVADWHSRQRQLAGREPLRVRELLTALIKAHAIQSALALDNPLPARGYDHVAWVRIATAALATALLDGTREQAVDALAHAFLDGAALHAYRHAPGAGARASWAAADAGARGVRLALLALAGETGCPSAASGAGHGFEHVVLGGAVVRSRGYASHAMQRAPESQELARFADAVTAHYAPKQAAALRALVADPARLDALPVTEFVAAMVKN